MRNWTHPVITSVLALPAALYGAAVRARLRRYARTSNVLRAPLPVISIGNITIGGTGKTTVAAWLVRRLQERGRRPAIVSRGYRSAAGRGPLLVSSGQGPRVGPRDCGDEPYLLSRSLPDAVVIVGSDRVRGAEQARAAGADVAILDDGFQHVRLHRDLDVVLLDAHSPFGNYRLLPAGTLREPAAGLARADVLVITRSRPGETFTVLERVVRRYNEGAPILRAGHRRAGFVDLDGNPVERPGTVIAFCGIGNPQAFETDLHQAGIEVLGFKVFRDHHPYSEADWRSLVTGARRSGAALLTTEKDLVRLTALATDTPDVQVCALRIEAEIHDEGLLMDRVERAVTGWRPPP